MSAVLLSIGGASNHARARSGASRKSVSRPVALVLVLDRAGSMAGYKLDQVKRTLNAAIRRLQPGDWVSVVTFDTNARVGLQMSRVGNRKKALTAVGRVAAAQYWVTMTPNHMFRQSLLSGVKAAYTQLRRLPKGKTYVGHVLFFVDGKPRSTRKRLLKAVRRIRKISVQFNVIELGHGANRSLLRAMVKAGGGNYLHWRGTGSGLKPLMLRLMKTIGR